MPDEPVIPTGRPASDPPDDRAARRQRLLVQLQGRRLDAAYLRPEVRRDLEAEAADPDPDRLVGPDELEHLRELVAQRQAALRPVTAAPVAELFFSTDQVVIVPGFMGSELSDLAPAGYGLIWLSPAIAFSDRLSALRLGPYDGSERDARADVRVEATGGLPVVYDLLRAYLELHRYTTEVHPVDWRKDLDFAADRLANRLRALAGAGRPIHLIAHSQGAPVARRALQVLHETEENDVLDRVRSLVLLGPANFGTFSAAFALAGTHSLLPTLRRFAVEPAEGFQAVLASMTGLYQLLPWDPARLPWLATHALSQADFWLTHVPVDTDRLGKFFGWGKGVDPGLFTDRTHVILGGNAGAPTPAGVDFVDGLLQPSEGLPGDGTIPHSCAVLPGASTYLAPAAEHSRLPLYRSVIVAVGELLAGRAPALDTASSDPADYLTPVAFAPAAFAAPAAAAVAAGPGPTAEDLVRLAEAVALARRCRVRVEVEFDGRRG